MRENILKNKWVYLHLPPTSTTTSTHLFILNVTLEKVCERRAKTQWSPVWSSTSVQSLSPGKITKGLCGSSLVYMQSSDYRTGCKLCYFSPSQRTAHSWKGDLSVPQLQSL